MSSPQTTSDVAAVADAIRSHDRFLLVTHENPDGDALGSILALKLALDQLGKDNVMYLYGEAPLPAEYSFMPLAELRRRLPDDWRERVQFAKLKLLARALERAQIYDGGRLVVSYLLRSDFTDIGAAEAYSEGIIDYLRAVEGADMAALIREPPRSDGPTRRVSLRASNDELDVSAIARKSGGGGHRQAAGFSSDASVEEITDFIEREFLASAPTRT